MSGDDSNQIENWIKQAFWFLIEELNFQYAGYTEGHSDFVSAKIKIRVEPGRKSPYTFVYYAGEPEFTRLTLFEVLAYFEGRPLDIDFQAHSLKQNLKLLADVTKNYIHKINDEIDKWWLPLHRSAYEDLKREYSAEGQLDAFLGDYQEWYEYLKSRGVM